MSARRKWLTVQGIAPRPGSSGRPRVTLSTFTNSRGQYNFYGVAPGQGTAAVENQQFPVAVGEREPSSTLRLNAPA